MEQNREPEINSYKIVNLYWTEEQKQYNGTNVFFEQMVLDQWNPYARKKFQINSLQPSQKLTQNYY